MVSGPEYPLSPHYGVDLRLLVTLAFDHPTPVPADPVPGGTIQERIQSSSPALTAGWVTSVEFVRGENENREARTIPAQQYWAVALPHRMLVLGPLLDIARTDMDLTMRLDVESRLLDVYYRRHLGVPLPPKILTIVRELAIAAPSEDLAPWLDAARTSVMTATALDEASAARNSLRADALRRGTAGTWGERTVSVAELMTDLILLCRAAREDVERAMRNADRFGGSVSLALQSIDNNQDTVFERVLPSLLRNALTAEDFRDDEREAVLAFASRRLPLREGLLAAPPIHRLARTHRNIDKEMIRAGHTDVTSTRSAETAAQSYARILEHLTKHIQRPETCRRLALIGVAHLYGVTHQRVLLCGPTGSGKTHAARTLAQAIGRPYLQIDMADITMTGFKGRDLPDVLDLLALRAEGGLHGAVLLLDEIDKIRVGRGTDGNSLEAKVGLQTSMLALLDGQPVTPDSGRQDQLETARLLVIGTGAFGGRFSERPPSTTDLIRWGWMPEIAARWGERISLSRLGPVEAFELLRKSDRSVEHRLGPLTEALGLRIEVPDEVLAYVVDAWLRTGADFRTAAEWLLTAARCRLIDALGQGKTERIILAPDDIIVSHGDPDPRRRSR